MDPRRAWIEAPDATFAEVEGDEIRGTCYLKTNQPGLGSHICNAGYIVAKAARRRGLGCALCAHSMYEARRRGYRAMQFIWWWLPTKARCGFGKTWAFM